MKEANEKNILIIGLILLISVLAITNGSLWGDEICRVVDPISGDLNATLHTALGYAQPGYMLYMMLWAGLVGTTEFLLRCSNLVFVIIAITYAMKIVKAKKWSVWYTLAFFVHPMFVYYMDEATPYIAVYALALAFIYHVFFVKDFHSTKNIVCINIIYLLGVFVHFMFGFIIVFYFVSCILYCRKEYGRLRRHIEIMSCFSPVYLILLYLYITNLKKTQTGFGLKSILYIIYSFLGMQGAGLSRNDLRAGNFSKIQIWQVIFLAFFVATLLLLLCLAFRDIRGFWKHNKDMLLSTMAFFAVICITAKTVDLGLWERHCMPAFPIYIICACDLFSSLYERSKGRRAVIILYYILLIGSCLNIRLNYYYACDDYKGMTQEVTEWLGDEKNQVIIMQDENDYYPIRQAAVASKEQITNMKGKTEEQIIEEMEHMSEIQDAEGVHDNRNVMLVLFEKDCSRDLYMYFDAKKGYTTDCSYNSFKLVTYVKP